MELFEFEQRKPIKGYPELHWTGKRPYTSTQYFPAQLKEVYGEPKEGWMNKIFWGDNLQVMSHMLKEYRGKIDLIYIDPPFDSKADYKKKIEVKGLGKASSDTNSFEEKQYGDIWTNDEYLQFMFERLTLMKELLADTGTIYLHCDWHKSAHLRLLLDEVFGVDKFINEIIWCYTGPGYWKDKFVRKHDTIFAYSKSTEYTFNPQFVEYKSGIHVSKTGVVTTYGGGTKESNSEELENRGKPIEDYWTDIYTVDRVRSEMLGYPTQKPEKLLERIISASSNPGDIVFDCFMGSGTTQVVAERLGRKYLGSDINLGSIQMAAKRLLSECSTGFEIYNVNNYDFFRNPIEAKSLLISALGIQKYEAASVYDGELDGYMVKIMPTNRIATKADLEELKANIPYKTWEKRKEENPNGVVEKIKIICMGHEADLKAALEQELSSYKLDIEILDILRDKSDLQFKREADANVVKENGKLEIKEFYPMNLLQKLSMQKESVDEWRQLVESVFIDWNYDGETMRPTVCDIPGKDEYVAGVYEIPATATRIKIKITDLLSESLEVEV